ncbi:hypothetical protein F5144DRAFT_591274 [Chaetomium tenue]|uniref:Uncharacterized protein n=1 Tax=Chaetomium tenue TaxID=1854479 RepID=A0ACB7PCF4_9PEZI|nr:hypothetical protein F5144DRAFT_591274 [Chaetomium globosum]
MAPPVGIQAGSPEDAARNPCAGTTAGPDTGFKWEVQLYGLDLTESNVFFLWLKQGGPDNQNNMNADNLSTPYFNITNGPLPVTTSKPSTATQLSTSSELSTSTSGPARSLSASSPPSTETTPSQTAPSAADDAESSSRAETGLPVGAHAGIGVAVSVVGITCIICALFWYRHLKKKRQLLAGAQQKDFSPYSSSGSDPWKVSELPPAHFQNPPAELRASHFYRSPGELHSGHLPVEIGAGRDFAEMPTPRDYRPSELGGQ